MTSSHTRRYSLPSRSRQPLCQREEGQLRQRALNWATNPKPRHRKPLQARTRTKELPWGPRAAGAPRPEAPQREGRQVELTSRRERRLRDANSVPKQRACFRTSSATNIAGEGECKSVRVPPFGEEHRDNFATIQFSAVGNDEVRMNVSYWPILGSDQNISPEPVRDYEFKLI